ncbi:MAG: nitroreductase family protein [Candidatus Micrarchaeota archaeon]
MEFSTLLQKRHSVRAYMEKEVEEEKLQKIISASLSAPSAGNLQAYKIFVIKNKEKKKQLGNASLGQECVQNAPIVLIFIADKMQSGGKYGSRGENLYSLQDATISASYAQLAAADLGLGSVWIGAFEPEKVAKIIGIDTNNFLPVAIIPIGYTAEAPEERERREKEKIVKEI